MAPLLSSRPLGAASLINWLIAACSRARFFSYCFFLSDKLMPAAAGAKQLQAKTVLVRPPCKFCGKGWLNAKCTEFLCCADCCRLCNSQCKLHPKPPLSEVDTQQSPPPGWARAFATDSTRTGSRPRPASNQADRPPRMWPTGNTTRLRRLFSHRKTAPWRPE